MTQLPILWFQRYKSTNNWKKPHLAPNAINISCLWLTCSLHLHFIFLFHLHLPLNFNIFYFFLYSFLFFLFFFHLNLPLNFIFSLLTYLWCGDLPVVHFCIKCSNPMLAQLQFSHKLPPNCVGNCHKGHHVCHKLSQIASKLWLEIFTESTKLRQEIVTKDTLFVANCLQICPWICTKGTMFITTSQATGSTGGHKTILFCKENSPQSMIPNSKRWCWQHNM